MEMEGGDEDIKGGDGVGIVTGSGLAGGIRIGCRDRNPICRIRRDHDWLYGRGRNPICRIRRDQDWLYGRGRNPICRIRRDQDWL